MKFIMFTKHLQGLELPEIITALQAVEVQGADLCVRPGYPVNPENAEKELPAASKLFAEAGLSIPLVTTPGDFLDPSKDETERVYAAAGEAGVENIKLGYWHWHADNGGYWTQVDAIRNQLEGFSKLSEQYGPRTCIHNHSGTSMGLNSCAVMNLVKGFDPQHVGVFADTGHLSIVGEPINMALDIVRSHLAVIAFKDLARTPGMRGGKVVRMGKGFVDWETTLNTLKSMEYSGPVSFHSEYSGEPVDSVIDLARVDVRFIQSLMKK
ncbi:TIM barrel protein [Candidatus Poribacteria bacterium]|nr:TIM barrel protein [Candidatus Poribacteria bacterium]MYB66191.1 TIM barrel protein [Candidatus Poribacteria bacterium]MYF56904.1 TIM barrel protein [Candidatus Poribacteria bacterium]